VERRGHRRASTPPAAFALCRAYRGKLRTPTVVSLASVSDPNQVGADAQVAAELAELEALAAALSAAEVDGVAPVQAPQDWS
jgi:hypothetical protein